MKLGTRSVQRLLYRAGYYAGAIDGDAGPKTMEAVEKVLGNHPSRHSGNKMSDARKLIAAAQLILHFAGHEPGDIDGYVGHNTTEAYIGWEYEQSNGKREDLDRDSDVYLSDDDKQGDKYDYPRQRDLVKFYGAVGTNQTRLLLPYPMRLAWNVKQTVDTTSCHEKVHDAFERILDNVAHEYGDKIPSMGLDLFGGCLNVRKMRGGSSYSTHSWGIAWDLDPAHNQLRWKSDRAKFAKPEYDAYWRIVEDAGAVSLGRARNFDWMHAQFARL